MPGYLSPAFFCSLLLLRGRRGSWSEIASMCIDASDKKGQYCASNDREKDRPVYRKSDHGIQSQRNNCIQQQKCRSQGGDRHGETCAQVRFDHFLSLPVLFAEALLLIKHFLAFIE